MNIPITRKDVVLFIILISVLYISTIVDEFSQAHFALILLAILSGGFLSVKLILLVLRPLITEINKRFSTKVVINRILLLLKLLWVLLFAYLGYISYDVGGEDALGYYIVFMILAFPSSLMFQYILRTLDSLGLFPFNTHSFVSELFFTLSFMLLGYFQWFICIPWLIKKVKIIIETQLKKKRQENKLGFSRVFSGIF